MSEASDSAAIPQDIQQLMASVAKSEGRLAPYGVSEHLAPRIEELSLVEPLAHFQEYGYAVIEDVASPEDMDALREVIHRIADASAGPGKGELAPYLLGLDPAIDRIATAPKLLAFAEVSVGNGMRASQFLGSIKRHSTADAPDTGGAAGIHADQNWMPAPFPEHNCVVTFCVPCEGMTAEGGATRVIPGSHIHRRHPTPSESAGDSIAIEVDKGSVAVWDGSVWHGSGQRTIPGTRTVLHATYQRLYTQPIDDYTYLLQDDDYMSSAPEAMRGLLGADLFFGTATREHMVDLRKFGMSSLRSKL